MQIDRLNIVFFSPTGSTKKALLDVAEGVNAAEIREYDLSRPAIRNQDHHFSATEMVLLGMPVYSGRIPSLFHHYARMHGANTPLVCVAVYGNREYEDALLEMKRLGEGLGFICVAAAAFVAEHNLNPRIATGRPDRDDLICRRSFGLRVREKMRTAGSSHVGMESDVPGKYPYRKFHPIPFAPDLNGQCIGCGLCARDCPVEAIDTNTFRMVRPDLCVFCYRCVSACPVSARGLNPVEKAILDQKLMTVEKECRESKDNEEYL